MNNDNPPLNWKTISTRDVYETPWIKVEHHDVITPAGTEGIYGVVRFKNIAIGVVPIDTDNHIWLVRQSRYTLGQYTWEIPEGGCPQGERPEAAAARELEEEVGIKAGVLEPILTMHLSNSVSDEYCEVFVAKNFVAGTQALEDSEDITVKKIHFDDALQMVYQGEITDAITVAALLRVAADRTGFLYPEN